MAKQMRVGVKAAWIGGICLIASAVVTAVIQNSKKDSKHSQIQNVGSQKTDSGSVNTYNAGGDIKIENNTYSKIEPVDTQSVRVVKEENRITEKKKIQPKNQIINNAPNQGVQINENNGTIIVPKPLQRNFDVGDAEQILKGYPTNYPIEIRLNGTNSESWNFFTQVVNVVKSLGYNNVTTTVVGVYASIGIIEKDFQYGVEDNKLIFSIYLQQ